MHPAHDTAPGTTQSAPRIASAAPDRDVPLVQLGAVKYLTSRYDLTRVPMAGASSGSLVACLSACGVDPQRIVDEAYQLSIDNDIWNRRLGVIGIWGGLIRAWLDALLPEDAHELCSGRVHVIIAKAPTLGLFEVRLACPRGRRHRMAHQHSRTARRARR